AMVFGGRRMWPRQVRAQRLLPWIWVVAVPLLYVARGVPVLSRYLLPLLPVLALLAWRAAEEWWLGARDPAPAYEAVPERDTAPAHEATRERGAPALGAASPQTRAPAAARIAALGALVAAVGLAQNLVVYRTSVLPQVRSFTAGITRTLIPWGRWLGAHA